METGKWSPRQRPRTGWLRCNSAPCSVPGRGPPGQHKSDGNQGSDDRDEEEDGHVILRQGRPRAAFLSRGKIGKRNSSAEAAWHQGLSRNRVKRAGVKRVYEL